MWEEHFEVAVHCFYPGDKSGASGLVVSEAGGGQAHHRSVYLFLMVD